MTIEVKAARAKTRPSELLSNIVAGEETIISSNEPTVHVVRVENRADQIAAIEALKVERTRC